MRGPTSGVRLNSFGFVPRYGSGDNARSAAKGTQLLAFSITPIAGENSNVQPSLAIRIDGQERGPLVISSDYIVTAVATQAKAIDLILTDSGTTQAISLLTGQADPLNPAVSSRANRTVMLNSAQKIAISWRTSNTGNGSSTGTITLTGVELGYWAPDGAHASAPDKAYLHIMATVQLDGDTKPYGAEAGLVQLTLPGAPAVTSRNVALDQATQVDDVIEVPATITAGTITYRGSVAADGGTVTVLVPATFTFTIPAG
jgi:hypothetical protein